MRTTLRQGSAGIDGFDDWTEICSDSLEQRLFWVCSAALAEEALTNPAWRELDTGYTRHCGTANWSNGKMP
jgi:hypothetical protein